MPDREDKKKGKCKDNSCVTVFGNNGVYPVYEQIVKEIDEQEDRLERRLKKILNKFS